jgi:hypothetical protein
MTETALDDFFQVYAIGLACASVCTNFSLEETTRRLNEKYPTGIHSRWAMSSDKTFASGQPNPNQCEDRADCRHVLFNC